jgi:hypothetical protein
MKFQVPRNQILKWTAFAAAVLIVTRLFFVQQLIAAFLIFSGRWSSSCWITPGRQVSPGPRPT